MSALTLLDDLPGMALAEPPAVRAVGVEAPAVARDGRERRPRPAATHGGGPTLDEVIVGAWEGLSAGRAVPCPVCAGAMMPRYGAGPGPVSARCGDCRSALA